MRGPTFLYFTSGSHRKGIENSTTTYYRPNYIRSWIPCSSPTPPMNHRPSPPKIHDNRQRSARELTSSSPSHAARILKIAQRVISRSRNATAPLGIKSALATTNCTTTSMDRLRSTHEFEEEHVRAKQTSLGRRKVNNTQAKIHPRRSVHNTRGNFRPTAHPGSLPTSTIGAENKPKQVSTQDLEGLPRLDEVNERLPPSSVTLLRNVGEPSILIDRHKCPDAFKEKQPLRMVQRTSRNWRTIWTFVTTTQIRPYSSMMLWRHSQPMKTF